MNVRNFFIGGVVITVAYFSSLRWIYGGLGVKYTELQLNEIGDLFAGIFSPVVLVWLIIGYLMQWSEIRKIEAAQGESKQAAQDQANRMDASIQAQEKMARAVQDQVRSSNESLEFERERFRISIRPRIEHDYAALEGSETILYFFVRDNPAMNIDIETEPYPWSIYTGSIAVEPGGRFFLSCTPPGDAPWKEFDVRLVFQDRMGEELEKVFRFGPDGNYDIVLLGVVE